MNFKDLKNIKPTLMSHGLPSSTMTDKEWQTEFELLKLYIRPYPKTITRMASKYLRETVKKDENDEIKYDGRIEIRKTSQPKQSSSRSQMFLSLTAPKVS